MAASDARPIPIKNTAYRATFPILDNDGDLVTGAAGLDSEVSKDAGTFTDCTNEATEIATSSGIYYLDLTSTEMNADTVAVIVKTTTTDAKTTTLIFHPQEAGDIKVDVESISGDTTAADNAEAFFDGTGYAGTNNVIPTVTSVTNQVTADVTAISGDTTAANNAELAFDGTGYGFTGCTMPTVTTLTGHTAQTGDNYARLGAPAGASVSADIAAVKVDTAATLVDTAEIGVAGAGLTNINLPNQTMDITGNITGNLSGSVGSVTGAVGSVTGNVGGNVTGSVGSLVGHTVQTADHTANISAILTDTGTTLETHLTDIKGATFSGATDSLEAIRNRGDSAWTTGAGGTPPQLLQNTTIATLASQTSFTLTAGSADDDAYNDALIIVTDSATSTQKAVGLISDYTGSTKTVTLSSDPAVFTMAVGDTVDVIATTPGSTAPTVAQIRAEMDSNSTQLSAIVADTNELQTDWVNGGRLDLLIDAILADTGELQTDWANGGRLDLLIDAIKAVTDALPDSGALSSLATAANLATVDTVVDAIKAVTDLLPDAGALNDLATILADTAEIQASLADGGFTNALIDTIITNIAALNDISTADVNAQVVDVLKTDTIAELAQGDPANTPTFEEAIMRIYMSLIHRLDLSSSSKDFYNSSGTVIWKKAVSDDGTTYTEAESASGP